MALNANLFYRNSILFIIGGITVIFIVLCGGLPWRCPLNYFFNIRCPGCGITRSIIAISQGQIILSLKYNPLGFLLVIGFVLYVVLFSVDVILKKIYLLKIINFINLWIEKHRLLIIVFVIVYVLVFLCYINGLIII